MKKVCLSFSVAGLLFVSCTPCDGCEDFYTHSVAVKNESEENLKVLFYDNAVPDPKTGSTPFLREELIINVGETVVREYQDVVAQPLYFSFAHSFSDSIVLKFDNEKGYYTTLKDAEVSVDYWIQNKSSFFRIEQADLINVNGALIYSITQEDCENAHKLP